MKLEDLLEEDGKRAAVEERVVERPHHEVLGLAAREHGDAHEGRFGEVEAAEPVGLEERIEPRLGLLRARALPRLDHERHGHFPVDLLRGGGEVLPAERGAEDVVALGDASPGALERGQAQRLVETADHLLEIDAGGDGVEAVEEHALLHRREGIGDLDSVGEAHKNMSSGAPPQGARCSQK